MKKQILLSLFFILFSKGYGGEKEDLKALEELYKEKKFTQAIDESKIFLDKYPASKYNTAILERIGKLYFFNNENNEAIKYFKILLIDEKVKDKEKDEIRYYLSKCYLALGDEKNSEEYLKYINPKSEYYEKTIFENGVTYLSRENYSSANRYFKKLLEIKGKYYKDAILNLAFSSYNEKKYEESIVYLKEYSLLKGDKNKEFMNYLLASSYYKIGKKQEAVTLFKELVAKNPKSEIGRKANLNLLEIYSNTGNTLDVEKSLVKITENKDYNEAMRILGDTYASKEDYLKAIDYYNKSNDFTSPKTLYSYGFSLFKLERLKEALPYFEKLKGSSEYQKGLYYILVINYRLQNYSEVLKYEKIIENYKFSSEELSDIYSIFANSAYEMNNYQLSKEYYKKVLNKNKDLETFYRVMVVDSKLGNSVEVEKNFKTYISLFPKDMKYRKNIYLLMGEIYSKSGRNNECINLYKNYLIYSKDIQIMKNLVDILINEQKYSEVAEYISYLPQDDNTQYLKGIVELGKGNYQKAEILFNSLLQTTDKTLLEKIIVNRIRNFFLWENYQEVVKLGEEYILKYPNNLEIMDKIGISYFRLEEFDKSIGFYEKLKTIPEYEEYATYQIADIYYSQKKYDLALENYKKVLYNYPVGKYQEDAQYWIINTLVTLNKIDEYEKERNTYLEKYPNGKYRRNIYSLGAELYNKDGNSQKLVENYENIYRTTTDERLKSDTLQKILDIKLQNNSTEKIEDYLLLLPEGEEKDYYQSLISIRKGEREKMKEATIRLLSSPKYSDYANITLGDYYFESKDYSKAKDYYENIVGKELSQYKEYALFKRANVLEMSGSNWEALTAYNDIFKDSNSKYTNISKLKAGQLYEKVDRAEKAENLYKELYKLGDSFEYRKFVVEKLLYFSLNKDKKNEAKIYYNELLKLDKESAEKYKKFF